MGFKLEMELEHGKQPSWLATELHVRAWVQDAWGWMKMLVPGRRVQSWQWYSLLGGEADEAAEDALGFLSLHSLPAQEGDAGLQLAGESQACF